MVCSKLCRFVGQPQAFPDRVFSLFADSLGSDPCTYSITSSKGTHRRGRSDRHADAPTSRLGGTLAVQFHDGKAHAHPSDTHDRRYRGAAAGRRSTAIFVGRKRASASTTAWTSACLVAESTSATSFFTTSNPGLAQWYVPRTRICAGSPAPGACAIPIHVRSRWQCVSASSSIPRANPVMRRFRSAPLKSRQRGGGYSVSIVTGSAFAACRAGISVATTETTTSTATAAAITTGSSELTP